MEKYKTRQIVTAVVSIIVIVIAIAALVSIARFMFFSGANTSSQVSQSESALVSTDADRAVKMTVRGPIVANENFHTYQITVTPNVRTLTVFSGYKNQVSKKISLGNNIPAYEQFVYALDRANMMRGTELTGDANDQRGVCATGSVYDFDILQSGKSIKQLWTSTCNNAHGSLSATLSTLRQLFNAQIPDVDSAISSFRQ